MNGEITYLFRMLIIYIKFIVSSLRNTRTCNLTPTGNVKFLIIVYKLQ